MPPYATPGSSSRTSVDRCRSRRTARNVVEGRLRLLRRSVDVFGFHLATLDLRQNSDVHESVVAELLARAGVHPDYAALPK